MTNATSVSVVDTAHGAGLTLLRVDYTKAGATNVVNVPAGHGQTVVWCDCNKISTLVKDPATAVSSLAVTMSAGTGDFTGLFLVED